MQAHPEDADVAWWAFLALQNLTCGHLGKQGCRPVSGQVELVSQERQGQQVELVSQERKGQRLKHDVLQALTVEGTSIPFNDS